jgi:Tfp pilus assembly ATPase PilU
MAPDASNSTVLRRARSLTPRFCLKSCLVDDLLRVGAVPSIRELMQRDLLIVFLRQFERQLFNLIACEHIFLLDVLASSDVIKAVDRAGDVTTTCL